jgi:hypothetical protein
MNIYAIIFFLLLAGLFYSFTKSIVKNNINDTDIKEKFKNSKNNIQNKENIFVPSDKFNGKKEGFVFKNDSKGVGYYTDNFYS